MYCIVSYRMHDVRRTTKREKVSIIGSLALQIYKKSKLKPKMQWADPTMRERY